MNVVACESVEVISDPNAMRALQNEWDALWQRAGGPHHLAFSVCWLCWTIVAKPNGRSLGIVTVRENGELVLVWPLVAHRRLLWTVIDPLNPETAEHTSVLMAEGAHAERVLSLAWQTATRQCRADMLVLPYIDAGTPLHRLVSKHPGVMAVTRDVCMTACLPKDGDWADFCATLGTLAGKKPGARHRRLAKEGHLVVRMLGPEDAESFPQWVTWLLERKRGWADRRGKHAVWLENRRYRDYLIALLESGDVHAKGYLCVITLNDEPIAASLIGLGKTTQVGIITGFNESVAKFGPGLLAVEHCVKHAFDKKLDKDFGAGTERFKDYWSRGNVVPNESFEIAATAWGRVAFLIKRLANVAKRAKSKTVEVERPHATGVRGESLISPPAA